MKPVFSVRTLLCTLMLALVGVGTAGAQAVTTSAVSGRVTDAQGQGVTSAQVSVTNVATGST
nr:hypothetical protein [Gemmatimonadota bacterium]